MQINSNYNILIKLGRLAFIIALFMGTGSISLVMAGENLIENGSFEKLVAGWGISRDCGETKYDFCATEGGKDGPYMGKLTLLSSGPESWVNISQMPQMPIITGEIYKFSMLMKAEKEAKVDVALDAFGPKPDEAGKKMVNIGDRKRITVGTEWQSYEVMIPIDTNQYVTMRCIIQLFTPNVPLYIDKAVLARSGNEKSIKKTLFRHVAESVKIENPPLIDGRLNDSCWEKAGKLTEFYRPRATTPELKTPAERTEVYLLHNKENLYVGFRCYESEPESIRAKEIKHDGNIWGDDCVEIFLAPKNSGPFKNIPPEKRYFHFMINTLGAKCESLGTDAAAWDIEWNAKVYAGKKMWEAEAVIPLSIDESAVQEDTIWRANFARSQKRLQEHTCWAPVEKSFHELDNFGWMGFPSKPNSQEFYRKALIKLSADEVRKIHLTKIEQAKNSAQDLPGSIKSEEKPVIGDVEKLLSELELFKRVIKDRSDAELLQAEQDDSRQIRWFEKQQNFLSNRIRVFRILEEDNSQPQTPRRNYVVIEVPAITDKHLLPYTVLKDEKPIKEIHLNGCRDEYESCSFAIVSMEDLAKVRIKSSPLRLAEREIPAENIDIKIVKCWYQPVGNIRGGCAYIGPKLLVPELLINDNDIVKVDLARETNTLRITDPDGNIRYADITAAHNPSLKGGDLPQDAAELLSFNSPAGFVQQIWITVHIPEDIQPGDYKGIITIAPENASPFEVPISMRVLPFQLKSEPMLYLVYYSGNIWPNPNPQSKDSLTEQQIEAMFRDMKAHGITSPLIRYHLRTPGGPKESFKKTLEICRRVKFPDKRLYVWDFGWTSDLARTNDLESAKKLFENQKEFITWMRDETFKSGFREFCFYATDENPRFLEQAEVFRAIKGLGGIKLWGVGNQVWNEKTDTLQMESFEVIKELMDVINVSGRPKKEIADACIPLGIKVTCYGNPQSGPEQPFIYRSNYGLGLWRAGYSGAIMFAYNVGFWANQWNEFDYNRGAVDYYRNSCYVYNTKNGVVGTMSWEGVREGIDDVKYMLTLLDAIEGAKKGWNWMNWNKRRLASKAEKWINSINWQNINVESKEVDFVEQKRRTLWDHRSNDGVDIDLVRRGIIEWIIKLKGL